MNQPNLQVYSPGTVLTVGSHNVKIIKYLTSGGFAQIYSVEIQQTSQFLYGSNLACLKRVVIPDKQSLNVLRAEVDTMKLLRNNKNVVSYIDSHAAKFPLQNGAYEVFLLMEYCERGGLIDFLNTRLQHRLQESEVLNIMSQVSQGVATMHALQPPLIHRDIKIENVLISKDNEFKLCDFGSVSGRIRPPNNPQEFAYVQHDIMKNTTAQYRSPEMVDISRGLPIDEKSDIWALGVFLYKLCYYTTPFEKVGESAILASKYQFPAYPVYSDNLKLCINKMLLQDPKQRPNIYQVVEEVSRLQGCPCPIVNFYTKPIITNNTVGVLSAPSIAQTPNGIKKSATVTHTLIDNTRQPSQPQQYIITGSGTGQYRTNQNPPFTLNKARSTSSLRNAIATSSQKKYHEHGLANDKFKIPTLNKVSKDEPKKVLPDIELSSSSDDEEEEERKEQIEDESLEKSILTSNIIMNEVKDNSSSSDDYDDDEKIISSINRFPKIDSKIRGRRSVSIVSNNVSKKEPIAIKVSDPFTSEVITDNIKPNKAESSKDQKELSKEDIKQKMLARLNAVDRKFKNKSQSQINLNTEKPSIKTASKNETKIDGNNKKKSKPPLPKKPAHLRPQKPPKPASLVGKKINEVAGSTSNI